MIYFIRSSRSTDVTKVAIHKDTPGTTLPAPSFGEFFEQGRLASAWSAVDQPDSSLRIARGDPANRCFDTGQYAVTADERGSGRPVVLLREFPQSFDIGCGGNSSFAEHAKESWTTAPLMIPRQGSPALRLQRTADPSSGRRGMVRTSAEDRPPGSA